MKYPPSTRLQSDSTDLSGRMYWVGWEKEDLPPKELL